MKWVEVIFAQVPEKSLYDVMKRNFGAQTTSTRHQTTILGNYSKFQGYSCGNLISNEVNCIILFPQRRLGAN